MNRFTKLFKQKPKTNSTKSIPRILTLEDVEKRVKCIPCSGQGFYPIITEGYHKVTYVMCQLCTGSGLANFESKF